MFATSDKRTALVATDLATQSPGTGWPTIGMGRDDQAKKSNPIKPQRHGLGCLGTPAALYKTAAGSEVRTVLVCYCATYGHLASCRRA